MLEFSKYYMDYLRFVFQQIFNFFYSLIMSLYELFVQNIANQVEILRRHLSIGFNAFDWILFVIVSLINIAVLLLIFYFMFYYSRKYIRFVKSELKKQQIIKNNEFLKREIFLAKANGKKIEEIVVEEKNLMLNLKTNDNLINETDTSVRFAKLIDVDQKYAEKPSLGKAPRKTEITLPELVEQFINFSASNLGLYYSKQVISAFFAGLGTSKILILEGISGTGKTSLPYAFGKFLGNDAEIISVQPSWRDKTATVGYLNEFTKRFNETDLLKALYEANYRKDPTIIVLDEMNLARIEYYFAEFLSILEMPNKNEWKIDVVSKQLENDPIKLIEGKVLIPQNIWFVGTANRDDSTFGITDKVYDRVVSIEINNKAEFFDAPPTGKLRISAESLSSKFKAAVLEYELSNDMRDKLEQLDDFITKKFNIMFGNRILKQIETFVPIYVACGNDELEALDFMVARKIIRKFEVLNLVFLQNELTELIAFIKKTFGKDEFKDTIDLIETLRRQI